MTHILPTNLAYLPSMLRDHVYLGVFRAQIMIEDQGVTTPACQQVGTCVASVPANAIDLSSMCLERSEFLGSLDIPDSNLTFFISDSQSLCGPVEVYGSDAGTYRQCGERAAPVQYCLGIDGIFQCDSQQLLLFRLKRIRIWTPVD